MNDLWQERKRKKYRGSVHVVIIVLNLGEGRLAERVGGLPIENLVDPVVFLGEDAQLELLLLFLHFVLALEEQFGDFGEGLLHGQLAEIGLLDLVPGQLTPATRRTSVVLVARACWLHHPKCGALHNIVAGHNNRRSVWSLVRVHSVHLGHICNPLSDHLARNLDAKVIMVLLCLLAPPVHQRSPIRYQAINNLKEAKISIKIIIEKTYTSDLSADGVGALVSPADHHLVDHDLLRTQNDAITADHSANRTKQKHLNESLSKLTKEWSLAYLDVSTAFSAYSTWKMRPSGLSELHS